MWKPLSLSSYLLAGKTEGQCVRQGSGRFQRQPFYDLDAVGVKLFNQTCVRYDVLLSHAELECAMGRTASCLLEPLETDGLVRSNQSGILMYRRTVRTAVDSCASGAACLEVESGYARTVQMEEKRFCSGKGSRTRPAIRREQQNWMRCGNFTVALHGNAFGPRCAGGQAVRYIERGVDKM